MTTECELSPDETLHYYGVFVEVPPRATCPHGEGPTVPTTLGVRILCPSDRDCWLVKWQWEQPAREEVPAERVPSVLLIALHQNARHMAQDANPLIANWGRHLLEDWRSLELLAEKQRA